MFQKFNKFIPYYYEFIGLIPSSLVNITERFWTQLFVKKHIQEGRNIDEFSRVETRVAFGFLLKITVVPLLLHFVGTTYIVKPVITDYWNSKPKVFITNRLSDKAVVEFHELEQELWFDYMLDPVGSDTPTSFIDPTRDRDLPMRQIGDVSVIYSQYEIEVLKLGKRYNKQSIEALCNMVGYVIVFSSLATTFRLCPVDYIIFKGVFMELLFNFSPFKLSMILYLVSSLTVGYHSTLGWESFIHGVLYRVGYPPSETFINMCVGTIPVLLGGVYKYWIFRTLTHISPATAATYHTLVD